MSAMIYSKRSIKKLNQLMTTGEISSKRLLKSVEQRMDDMSTKISYFPNIFDVEEFRESVETNIISKQIIYIDNLLSEIKEQVNFLLVVSGNRLRTYGNILILKIPKNCSKVKILNKVKKET
eukprot:UN03658